MPTAHINVADHEEIVIALRAQFAARVTDLLEANNRYLERARDAETRVRELEAELEQVHQDAAGASI